MKIELNQNQAILAKVFPLTWENWQGLSWQFGEDIRGFLFTWLVEEWDLVSGEEFEDLSTVELFALNEWAIVTNSSPLSIVD